MRLSSPTGDRGETSPGSLQNARDAAGCRLPRLNVFTYQLHITAIHFVQLQPRRSMPTAPKFTFAATACATLLWVLGAPGPARATPAITLISRYWEVHAEAHDFDAHYY